MAGFHHSQSRSAIFITFSGNCKKALTFYQACFGGVLHLDTFKGNLPEHKELPVVSGSLVADGIVIHGSDLVHSEGRKLGNHIAVFLHCISATERKAFIQKLRSDKSNAFISDEVNKLIEIVDDFDVRWIMGI